jgi:hypothetical protein
MDNNSRQALAEGSPNWPELLSKTIDDLSRIARTEMELLVAKLGLLLEAQTDKITGVRGAVVRICVCAGRFCSVAPSLDSVVAFFFDHWDRGRHSRGFVSDDDEGGRQKKGNLRAVAAPYMGVLFRRERAEKMIYPGRH